jgi:hypothetical protein
MTRPSDPPPSETEREAAPAPPVVPAEPLPGAEPSVGSGQEERGSFLEWFTRREALASAENAFAAAPPLVRELHRRARFALEIGDRARDPVDPYRMGQGEVFAVEAYRQSIYWSLRVLTEAAEQPASTNASSSVLDLFDERVTETEALLPARSHDRIRAILARDFARDAEEADASIGADALLLHDTALALASRVEGPQTRIDTLRAERRLRGAFGIVLAALLLLAAASAVRAALRKPDLAKNKAWRTSSTYVKCAPAKHDCGGAHTDIFFHTLEDTSPWIEFDLGAPTTFSSLSIKNRVDCCDDRAVPLVVEVGNDAKNWVEVARRTQTFETWQPSFAPQSARYVRLRVARKSVLHLERVAIHK